MIASIISLLSKLVRARGRPLLAALGNIFLDLALLYLAGAVLMMAYFTISRAVPALEFRNLFGRVVGIAEEKSQFNCFVDSNSYLLSSSRSAGPRRE